MRCRYTGIRATIVGATLHVGSNPGSRVFRNEARISMTEEHGFIRTEPPRSPLDPFLCQFLHAVEEISTGYLPASDRHRVTSALGWPIDFGDAIMTSAQARGMVERVPTGPGRRRVLWRVSTRGRRWLEMTSVIVPLALESEPDLSAPQPAF